MILFKDILTVLRLDYEDDSLIILYLFIIGLNIPKINISYKKCCQKS